MFDVEIKLSCIPEEINKFHSLFQKTALGLLVKTMKNMYCKTLNIPSVKFSRFKENIIFVHFNF